MDVTIFDNLNYSKWRREARLFSPKWTPVDEDIGEICFEYANSSAEERAYVRSRIKESFAFTLLSYIHRTAVFAIRENNQTHIMNGLIALAMINESGLDPRDWGNIVDPSIHIYAANKIGADIDKHLNLAIKLADKSTADWLEKFVTKKIVVDVSSYEEAEVETTDGFGLISTGRRSSKHSINLKQAALEMMHVIESDGKYLVYQITPSEELPDYWLSGIRFHDSKPNPLFDNPIAGIKIDSAILEDENEAIKGQYLNLWLCEFSKSASVNSILRASKSTKPKSYILSVLAENRLLCITVSRSMLQGGKPYETSESIKGYDDSLINILKKYSNP